MLRKLKTAVVATITTIHTASGAFDLTVNYKFDTRDKSTFRFKERTVNAYMDTDKVTNYEFPYDLKLEKIKITEDRYIDVQINKYDGSMGGYHEKLLTLNILGLKKNIWNQTDISSTYQLDFVHIETYSDRKLQFGNIRMIPKLGATLVQADLTVQPTNSVKKYQAGFTTVLPHLKLDTDVQLNSDYVFFVNGAFDELKINQSAMTFKSFDIGLRYIYKDIHLIIGKSFMQTNLSRAVVDKNLNFDIYKRSTMIGAKFQF